MFIFNSIIYMRLLTHFPVYRLVLYTYYLNIRAMMNECLMTEFRIQGDDCPLADASRDTGAIIDAASPLMRDDGNVLLRFSSAANKELVDFLDDDDRVRYLYQSTDGDRMNYRCLSLHPCVIS